MRKYIFISIGGFLGAICRFAVKNIPIFPGSGKIPVNTLITNIIGSFILALLLSALFDLWKLDEDTRLSISTGFLGAFTTFSTLCRETVLLLEQGFYLSAVFYIAASTILGLAAAYTGAALAGTVSSVYSKNYDENHVKRAGMIKTEDEVD